MTDGLSSAHFEDYGPQNSENTLRALTVRNQNWCVCADNSKDGVLSHQGAHDAFEVYLNEKNHRLIFYSSDF